MKVFPSRITFVSQYYVQNSYTSYFLFYKPLRKSLNIRQIYILHRLKSIRQLSVAILVSLNIEIGNFSFYFIQKTNFIQHKERKNKLAIKATVSYINLLHSLWYNKTKPQYFLALRADWPIICDRGFWIGLGRNCIVCCIYSQKQSRMNSGGTSLRFR